jgi:hypothetical protein
MVSVATTRAEGRSIHATHASQHRSSAGINYLTASPKGPIDSLTPCAFLFY